MKAIAWHVLNVSQNSPDAAPDAAGSAHQQGTPQHVLAARHRYYMVDGTSQFYNMQLYVLKRSMRVNEARSGTEIHDAGC